MSLVTGATTAYLEINLSMVGSRLTGSLQQPSCVVSTSAYRYRSALRRMCRMHWSLLTIGMFENRIVGKANILRRYGGIQIRIVIKR